jgi:hypothetical protein
VRGIKWSLLDRLGFGSACGWTTGLFGKEGDTGEGIIIIIIFIGALFL